MKFIRFLQQVFLCLILFGLQSLCLAIDDDDDGLSDVFEREHGGDLDPNDDSDADGFSNFEEYRFGGNPLLNGDLVQIFDSVENQNDITVSWFGEIGLRYVIEVSGDLNTWRLSQKPEF